MKKPEKIHETLKFTMISPHQYDLHIRELNKFIDHLEQTKVSSEEIEKIIHAYLELRTSDLKASVDDIIKKVQSIK